MRIMRTLLLAALAATAALALTASSASAQHNVEVEAEPGGVHCAPCKIHATSIGTTLLIVEGVGPVSACQDEFEGEVYENGEGHITQQTLAGDVGTCNVEPCTHNGEDEWPVELSEEDSELHLWVRFCVGPRGSHDATNQSHCTLHGVPVVDEGTHHYIINPDRTHHECEPEPPHPHRFVEGSWEITQEPEGDHTNIEVKHPAG